MFSTVIFDCITVPLTLDTGDVSFFFFFFFFTMVIIFLQLSSVSFYHCFKNVGVTV